MIRIGKFIEIGGRSVVCRAGVGVEEWGKWELIANTFGRASFGGGKHSKIRLWQ